MTPDMQELLECEGVIKAHMTTTDWRTAAARIRDRCLYRARGYATLEDYCRDYWGDQWIKLQPVEVRRELVVEKRAAGKSLRTIGTELGIDPMTARSDLSIVENSTMPDRVTTSDGRTYPATRAQPAKKKYRQKGDPDYGKPHVDHVRLVEQNLRTLDGVLTTFEVADLSKVEVVDEWISAVHQSYLRLQKLERALIRAKEAAHGE